MCEKNLECNYDNSGDNSAKFEEMVASRVRQLVEQYDGKLFKTNSEGLADTLLYSIPIEAKQHYTCNACRHFLNRFGGLVAIDNDGNEHSIWEMNMKEVPVFYREFVKKALDIVSLSKVVDVFVPESKMLGFKRTGEWTHMYGEVPKSLVHKDRLKTAYQVQAEKKQDFQMLITALLEFNLDTAKKAVSLLESETLYRSDKVLGIGKWFKELHEKRNSVKNSKNQHNLTWLAVANAPIGFTHIKSSMIGTLLDDIQSGMSTQSVSSRFAEKMNPSTYQRSQSAPTQNAVLEAEKIVAKLGIENSLQRRYATLDDVPDEEKIWKPIIREIKLNNVALNGNTSVFGHLPTKEKMIPTQDSAMNLPSKVMTWEKFAKTVLPTAVSIEALSDNPNRFMALVTASHEDAPNILQWNNTVSWYYHGGVDGEIKRRIENAGGRHENNEIRCSLIWENYTDLDLHCLTPNAEHISFSHKRARNCNGYLDIDMNAGGKDTMKPVENIRWSDNAPSGRYKFFVHNYAERSNGYFGGMGTPFKVELEINGQIFVYHGDELSHKGKVTVFEFDYTRGQAPKFLNNNHSTEGNWNAESNRFVKVNAITSSPNQWGKDSLDHSAHVFFLLDGVSDTTEGRGRGFFNEMLKPELREIRKTLEMFTANTPIEDVENASACGLGYNKENDWNLTLKVKTSNSEQLIKIDRWD